jgi:hypothetical protein
MTKPDPLADWRSNPFFVLDVGIEASRTDVERTGQKLLALLAIGSVGVEHYQTPLGPAIRDADMVRQALAALRDPSERVLQELWANIAPDVRDERNDDGAEGWAAEHIIGWTGTWPA